MDPTTTPGTALVLAVNRSLEELEAALAVDATRYREAALNKALQAAAADGEYRALARLLREPGWTPTSAEAGIALFHAAANGHDECCSLLLESCAQITVCDCSAALHEGMDEADVVRALAADERTVPSARALAQAAAHESAEIRELFAELGARTADLRRQYAAAGVIEA